MKVVVFIFSILVLSCNSQKKVTENNEKIKQNLEVTLLNEDFHGGYVKAKNLVIKTEEELQKIYRKVNMMRRPGIPVPKIDWENEMVIALFMGEKNTGGYRIAVENIVQNSDDSLEIMVKETAPQGITTMVITQPFYFCKVKRTDNEITFKKVD